MVRVRFKVRVKAGCLGLGLVSDAQNGDIIAWMWGRAIYVTSGRRDDLTAVTKEATTTHKKSRVQHVCCLPSLKVSFLHGTRHGVTAAR